MNSTTQTDIDITSQEVNFDNLYPVLLQTFTVIVLGYLSGRWNIIGSIEAKGLNTFVGHFALPCLIFTALAELDFGRVNWTFLMSIFISKTTVFLAVMAITLLVTRPMDLTKAGLFAIFCTQSNDFALGYPIVEALYGNSHPEYAKYIYVVAPISLAFLNPLAFLCMELGNKRRESLRLQQIAASQSSLHDQKSSNRSLNTKMVSRSGKSWKLCLSVWKNMILSPAVLMTVLGILANFLFQHEIPPLLKKFFGVLGSAFSATALFALGLRMVGKMQDLAGAKLVVPGILIGVKCLVLPIVTREVTLHLEPGHSPNASLELSNLGFLLGTFPSAPSSFIFAVQYNVAIDLIATAMVACTFVSMPLTFVSARMLSLAELNPADYTQQLDGFLLHVAIVGLVCTMFMLLSFVASKKWKKIPHFTTLCLTLSQFMACAGVVLWYTLDRDEPWKEYLQFMLFAVGVFSSRLWTALLSVTLLLLKKHNLSLILNFRPVLAIIGWGIPTMAAITLATAVTKETNFENTQGENPNFQYGRPQALVASSILILCFSITVICLVWQQRHKKSVPFPVRSMSTLSTESSLCSSGFQLSNQHCKFETSLSSSTIGPLTRSSSLIFVTFNGNYSGDKPSITSESLFSPSDEMVDIEQYETTSSMMLSSGKKDTRRLTEPEEYSIVRDRDDEFQILRHVILLLALCCSMFVGIALCVWTLVMEELTGIYIMLLFLDEILNFGQGIFVLVLFGLDTRRLLVPFWTSLQFLSSAKSVTWLPKSKFKEEASYICEQFMTFYMDKCARDLVRDRRWHLKQYSNVFCGHELVDWLLVMGLCQDRSDAEDYGRCLLQGGVIYHVEGRKDFFDQPFFYSFHFLSV